MSVKPAPAAVSSAVTSSSSADSPFVSLIKVIPDVVKGIFGGGSDRKAEAERRQMDAEMEKERMKIESEKMKMNLDAMKTIQEQNAATMNEITRGHNEMLRQLDESNRIREDEARKEARELRQQQLEKENEMRNASRAEREKMREEYSTMQKEKEDEMRTIREEFKRERKEEQDKFEEQTKKLKENERILRERMLEQEKEHSNVVQQLMIKHGEDMKEQHENRLQDSKDHANKIESLMRLQIEEAAENARIHVNLMIAHSKAKEHATLAEHFNIFRVVFANVRTIHYEGIKHLTTATEDDRAISIGQAKGTQEIMNRELDKLDAARNTVMAALDRSSSLPIEVRAKQKEFLDGVSRSLNAYSTHNHVLVGKLCADPPRQITASEVGKLSMNFDNLHSSMDAIPLLPITDDFASQFSQAKAIAPN